MSKDKQIEEMAKDFCALNMPCEECHLYKNRCHAKKYATRAYNAGYRKASEIFEEIEERISTLEYQANSLRKTVKVEELKAQVDWVLHEVVPQTIAELKKRYTESEKGNEAL